MKKFYTVRSTEELCKFFGKPITDAPRIRLRTSLVINIEKIIRKKGYSHAQAAKKANVGRTVITGIINGNIRSISTDRLIDIASSLGVPMTFKVGKAA